MGLKLKIGGNKGGMDGINQKTIKIHGPDETVSDWRAALRYLKEGNRRYREGNTIVQTTSAGDRAILAGGQTPLAAVVTCSDARVAPEIYFDQKLGDIFVVRNTGNIVGATVLGAVEFAIEFARIPLVVMVGHSDCRAVISAFNGGEYPENLRKLMDAIIPAIKTCRSAEEAIRANLNHCVRQIKENPTVIRKNIKVIGAHYNIETGEVVFDDDGVDE